MSPLYKFLKNSFKRTIHSFKWDLVRYNVHTNDDLALQTTIDHFRIDNIIDGGANAGQYGERLIENGFKGKIFSFEPIPSVFNDLKKNAAGHTNWEVYNLGLGADESELLINVSENFVSSSLLKVGAQSLAAEPTTRTTHQEKVRITTIDKFFSGQKKLQGETLLKLDIQGYEMEALRGSLQTLPQVKMVQVELSFVQVYENGPLFPEISSFMEARGFELYNLMPVFHDHKTGRMLQGDGVFVRK
jgi:FkbM family methyltransferase